MPRGQEPEAQPTPQPAPIGEPTPIAEPAPSLDLSRLSPEELLGLLRSLDSSQPNLEAQLELQQATETTAPGSSVAGLMVQVFNEMRQLHTLLKDQAQASEVTARLQQADQLMQAAAEYLATAEANAEAFRQAAQQAPMSGAGQVVVSIMEVQGRAARQAKEAINTARQNPLAPDVTPPWLG
jgi:hypothetical protein